MIRKLLFASALTLVVSGPALAQSPRMDPTAASTGMTGTMTADQVGVQPMTGVSAADFVAQAAASDMFEIQSSKIAEHKSKDKAVKSFAAEMIKDHTATTKTLLAALSNAQRTIAKPSDVLPSDKQAMIDQLKATPRGQAFDSLYLSQQLQGHQKAWALHKGYAMGGDDAALREVASTAVPVVESHLTMLKSLPTT